MLSKLRKKSKTENFSFFLQFFTVFTGIFIVMTVIILQVMRVGLYSSVDNKLIRTAREIDQYVTWVMEMPGNPGGQDTQATDDNSDHPMIEAVPTEKLAANTTFILYDKDGNILNNIASLSTLSNLKLKTKNLNSVYSDSPQNDLGYSESFHLVTVKVESSTYTELKYATVAVNVTQIEESTARYSTIIVSVMIIFWFLSVGASVYLARWSMRPILANYEKQKSFVENASHELRTPLAVLQNRLESLFRQPNATVLEQSENIAASLDEVRNMRILTTNLLNLARRDDGIKPELTEVQPSFFDDVFENYTLIAEENDKIFTYQNQVTRSFKTDKTLLKQLMTILFDNAIKYTEDSGIIDFKVRSTDKNIYLTISDNGFGISDEDKKQIFDRFYRVDKARTRQKGGFGLGLSLAKQIVDSLKGSIHVKDNRPKGTIFEVKL